MIRNLLLILGFASLACSCSTSRQSADHLAIEEKPVIACMLQGDEFVRRKAELQQIVFSKAKTKNEIATGYEFTFDHDEQFVLTLTEYILAENTCCPFLKFGVELQSDRDVLVRISGPPEAKKMIEMATK